MFALFTPENMEDFRNYLDYQFYRIYFKDNMIYIYNLKWIFIYIDKWSGRKYQIFIFYFTKKLLKIYKSYNARRD